MTFLCCHADCHLKTIIQRKDFMAKKKTSFWINEIPQITQEKLLGYDVCFTEATVSCLLSWIKFYLGLVVMGNRPPMWKCPSGYGWWAEATGLGGGESFSGDFEESHSSEKNRANIFFLLFIKPFSECWDNYVVNYVINSEINEQKWMH